MKHFLLACLLFAGTAAFTQKTKQTTKLKAQANVPAGLYALTPTNAVANGTTVDTSYLSSADFSGTGSVADPIRIKTSVIQSWLEALPGFASTGGKYLASDFTWQAISAAKGIPALASNSYCIRASSSAILLTWTDVANETSYLLQHSTDNASWVTLATPQANSTQFTNSGLSPSTPYYFRIRAIGDNTNYADSPFDGDVETTLPAGGTNSSNNVLFDVANANQIQQHPDGPGTYFSSQGAGVAKAQKKLAAGSDGIVYFKYIAGSGAFTAVGYTTDNALRGYEHWTGGVYLLDTRVKAIGYNGSTVDMGMDAINNHFYGFRRNGNAIEVVTSTDETNWTVLGLVNYAPSDLFMQIYLQTTPTKIKLFGQNLVSY